MLVESTCSCRCRECGSFRLLRINQAVIFSQTPLSRQRAKRTYTRCHWPNCGGRSRHGAPVRPSHNTASTKPRVSGRRRPHYTRPTQPRQLPALHTRGLHHGLPRASRLLPRPARAAYLARRRRLRATVAHQPGRWTLAFALCQLIAEVGASRVPLFEDFSAPGIRPRAPAIACCRRWR